MSSFIKTIDTSSTPSSSNIIVSAVLNEINDRNNAISVAIQKEITLRDNAITQQVSSLPTRTDITSMIGNSISTFNTTLLASNSFTTAQQVSTMIGNSVNTFNTSLSTATNTFITALQANNMIVAYNYLTSSQITTLIGTFGYQSLSQIQNLGYQTLNNVTSLGYQTAINVKDIITTYGYTTIAQVYALNYQTLPQVNTLVTTALNNSPAGGTTLGFGSRAGTSTTAIGYQCYGNSNNIENTGVGYQCALNLAGNFNTAYGSFCLINANSGAFNVGIGHRAGNNMITGSNNTFLGALTSTILPTCTNSTAVGNSAVITDNNQIMLGTSGNTVVLPGIIQQNTTAFLLYTTLPVFTANQIGYQTTYSAGRSFSLKLGPTNTETIPLPVGIWHLAFRFDLNISTNTSVNGFLNYGISNGSTGYQQYTQSTFNLDPNIAYPFSNSCVVKSTNLTYTLVIILPPQLVSPTNYLASGQFFATRIA